MRAGNAKCLAALPPTSRGAGGVGGAVSAPPWQRQCTARRRQGGGGTSHHSAGGQNQLSCPPAADRVLVLIKPPPSLEVQDPAHGAPAPHGLRRTHWAAARSLRAFLRAEDARGLRDAARAANNAEFC